MKKLRSILRQIMCRHLWTVDREFVINKADCVALRCIRCPATSAHYL